MADPRNPVEGDHFVVEINGQDYDTVIENNVQRFVGNRIVAAFIDSNVDLWSRGYRTGLSLNDISYVPGDPYTLDELIQFSTLHRYSVSGLCDLSFMEGVEVDNPLWN